MEFVIDKCTMLVMKSGKRRMAEGVEPQNQVVIRTLREKETYKYLGILEDGTIKQVEMKKKIKKEYFTRIRKLLDKSSIARSLKKGINT